MVVNGEVKKSINIIKKNINNDNSKFFEARLLLLIDGFKKKEFKENIELLYELKKYQDQSNYHYIIYEVLKSYNDLFLTKEINLNEGNFGKLSLINEVFQYCYLNEPNTDSKFINLINSEEGDYTRYLFFYFNNLIKKKKFEKAISISSSINELSSNLLIQQAKKWIDNSNFHKFSSYSLIVKFQICVTNKDLILFYLIKPATISGHLAKFLLPSQKLNRNIYEFPNPHACISTL